MPCYFYRMLPLHYSKPVTRIRSLTTVICYPIQWPDPTGLYTRYFKTSWGTILFLDDGLFSPFLILPHIAPFDFFSGCFKTVLRSSSWITVLKQYQASQWSASLPFLFIPVAVDQPLPDLWVIRWASPLPDMRCHVAPFSLTIGRIKMSAVNKDEEQPSCSLT